jgi:hypothetical protein
MSVPLNKTSFASGELAPALLGRVDLTKYQAGAQVMRNMFVDFRGGASTRAGTKHVGVCRDLGVPPCLMPFRFSTAQSYMLELNDLRLRIIYRGAYITEAVKAVSGATRLGATLVLQIVGSGYAAGDYVYLSGVSGLVRANGISGVNGRTVKVLSVVGNNVTLDTGGDSTSWSAYASGGTAARVYEVTTPWAGATLFDLKYVQSADVLTVTHPDYPPYDIKRFGNTNWTVTQETFGATVSSPATINVAALNNDTSKPQFFYRYAVTSVDSGGRESPVNATGYVVNRALDQNQGYSNQITWSAEPGAKKYRIYTTQRVGAGTQTAGPWFWGLIGNSYETTFQDLNYAADYDTSPPEARNPFKIGALASPVITAAGSGYLQPAAVITDANGQGAQIALYADTTATAAVYGALTTAELVSTGVEYTAPSVAVVEAAPAGSGLVLAFSGAWVLSGGGYIPVAGSITILNGGTNYHRFTGTITARAVSNPVAGQSLPITITKIVNGVVTAISVGVVTPNPAAGLSSTGADTLAFTYPSDVAPTGGTVTVSIAPENSPSCVTYFQQRRVFAGSDQNPATLWLSRPGQYTNFDGSDPVQDDDGITITVVGQEVNIIQSLTAVQKGVIVLTTGGAWQVSGGGTNNAVTPTQIQADGQEFTGSAGLMPLRVKDDLLYVLSRGSAVCSLSYNFYVNVFTGRDVSVLSSHLLDGHALTQWTWVQEPFKLAWAVRDDGILLSLCYFKEQEVAGWSRHDTSGLYVSVASIPENTEDVLYCVVRRYTPGLGWAYHTERMASRLFGADVARTIRADPEQTWCVDDGAAFDLTPGAATLALISTVLSSFSFMADAAVFTSADIGKVLRFTGAKGVVTDVPAADQITVAMSQLPPGVPNLPYLTLPPLDPGDWTLTAPVSVIGGLDHLNGSTVQVLADGGVQTPKLVIDGCITLDTAASSVLVGLGFSAQLQTPRFDAGQPTIQGRRKIVSGTTVRMLDSRGIMAGATWDSLTEIKQRTFEPMGTPIVFETGGQGVTQTPFDGAPTAPSPLDYGDYRINLDSPWYDDGIVCLQQSYPLPATILAVIPEILVGDDPEP